MMRFLASLEMTRPLRERDGAVSGGCAADDCLFTRTVCGVIPNGVRNLVTVCGLLRAAALAMTVRGSHSR